MNSIKVIASFSLLLSLLAGCGMGDRIYDWEKRYRYYGDEPYDINVFYQLLAERDKDLRHATNDYRKLLEKSENTNLIQIGAEFRTDSSKLIALCDYVYRGNNAYIIAQESPYDVFYKLYGSYSSIWFTDTVKSNIEVGFVGDYKHYEFEHQHELKVSPFNWSYLRHQELYSDSASSPISLSNFDDSLVNYFKINYGDGTFYIHTQPVLFTNFMLKEKSGFEHMSQVFETLNDGQILWDESYNYFQAEEGERAASPLKLFFSHVSLKWGWYVLLIMALLFLLFRSKRQQRIIPIMPVNRNESMEFARNIGNLYFTSNNHKYIVEEMYDTFLADARHRYQIDTNQEAKDVFKQIAKKSGLGDVTLTELYDYFNMRLSEMGSNEELIKLYNTLTNYYNQRK